MASGIIYKPQTRKGPVLIVPTDLSAPPTITLSDGRVVTAVKGDRAGGTYKGHEGYQWVFPDDVLGQENATLTAGGETQELGNTNMSYRGSSLGSLEESSKGAIGDVGSFNTAGGGAGLAPGQVGYGAAPAYIGDKFPKAVTTNFDPISGAAPNYKYIDPMKFGEQFNPFQRSELKANFGQAKSFALDAIDTEFDAINRFTPQAAALKREEVGRDNTFNQAERTRQVNEGVPDVKKDLEDQAGRARTYASGVVPDSAIDRGLSVGTASRAADAAYAGGFGTTSQVSRNLSSLMSAKERIALSQYGEELLSANASARTSLNLAPTQYSNAGGQVNVNPTLSGSQLQQQNFSEINPATIIQASQGYTSSVQQSQYFSDLDQRTQEFNSSNTLQNDQFNATNLNNFALSFFNYLNSYANSLAGAAQTNINTGIGLDQQAAARDESVKQRDRTQRNNTAKDVAMGAAIIGAVALSDRRLKENIVPTKVGLSEVIALDPVAYTMKPGTPHSDNLAHIGILAQDLKQIIPSAVSVSESGYLQVDHAQVIYALVNAVKELNNKIAILEGH